MNSNALILIFCWKGKEHRVRIWQKPHFQKWISNYVLRKQKSGNKRIRGDEDQWKINRLRNLRRLKKSSPEAGLGELRRISSLNVIWKDHHTLIEKLRCHQCERVTRNRRFLWSTPCVCVFNHETQFDITKQIETLFLMNSLDFTTEMFFNILPEIGWKTRQVKIVFTKQARGEEINWQWVSKIVMGTNQISAATLDRS